MLVQNPDVDACYGSCSLGFRVLDERRNELHSTPVVLDALCNPMSFQT